MGPVALSRNVGKSPRDITEGRRFHLHRDGSLKSRSVETVEKMKWVSPVACVHVFSLKGVITTDVAMGC